MHRLTVLYPAKDGVAFAYDYHFNNHHKLGVSRLKPEGLVSCEFDKGVSDLAGGKAPYHLSQIQLPRRTSNRAGQAWRIDRGRHPQLHDD